ncbi:MAG: DUF4038 domain-containing protein [Bacteroidia bacterium]
MVSPDEWLDFGPCIKRDIVRISLRKELIKMTITLTRKPTLDGEPLYEDHPNCFNAKELGHSFPEDFRRIMYWNVFAGGFGQTYGCHDVWQMYTNDKTPVNQPLRPWPKALDLPGANQVKHLKNLMLSPAFLSRIPDPLMVLTAQAHDHTPHHRHTRLNCLRLRFIFLS